MPSSTFNSRKGSDSVRVLFSGFLFACFLAVVLEISVAHKFWYGSTILDSASLWGYHRERARRESNPIILVGGSRIQLGISVSALEYVTARPVVQLAIDGQPSMPILKHLADDEKVSGTILVSLREAEFTDSVLESGTIYNWIEQYEQRHRETLAPNIEAIFKTGIQRLLTYHAIEYPPAEIFKRFFTKGKSVAYIITDSSRNRDAHYRLVKLPDLYIKRVMKELGVAIRVESKTMKAFNEAVLARLKQLPRRPPENIMSHLRDVKSWVQKIEQRGGRVVFVRMPTDKLVREIDEWRYPGKEIHLAIREAGLSLVNIQEWSNAGQFRLPDGSHLDASQKREFTLTLLEDMYRQGWL